MQSPSNTELSNWPDAVPANVQYSLRSFTTELCDLDIDFAGTRQPYLVTQLLSCCMLRGNMPVSEDEIWSWSLKKRLQALLAIAMKSRGSRLVLHTHCSDHSCDERIELPLELDMFQLADLDERFIFKIDGKALQVRLPNGEDQRYWLKHQDEALTAIAGKLVLRVDDGNPADGWCFREEWLEDFSEALEDHDVLMSLQLNSVCPVCDRELKIPVDLEAHLLICLSHLQQKLLMEVHQLALAYHWTEKDILALTPQRRNYYLMRLRDASEGSLS